MRRSQHVLSFVFGFMMFSLKDRTEGLLYPHESETREVKSLDGMWNFVKSNETAPTEGIRNKWYLDDLSKVLYSLYSNMLTFVYFVYFVMQFFQFDEFQKFQNLICKMIKQYLQCLKSHAFELMSIAGA